MPSNMYYKHVYVLIIALHMLPWMPRVHMQAGCMGRLKDERKSLRQAYLFRKRTIFFLLQISLGFHYFLSLERMPKMDVSIRADGKVFRSFLFFWPTSNDSFVSLKVGASDFTIMWPNKLFYLFSKSIMDSFSSSIFWVAIVMWIYMAQRMCSVCAARQYHCVFYVIVVTV